MSTVPKLILSVGLLLAWVPTTGCGGWVMVTPAEHQSTDPEKEFYRLVMSSDHPPANLEIANGVATLLYVGGDSATSRAIVFSHVDVVLKHHTGRDKWEVNIRKPDGKLIHIFRCPTQAHAHELAAVLLTLKSSSQ